MADETNSPSQSPMAQPPFEPLEKQKHIPPKIWVPLLVVVALAVAYLGIASAYDVWPFGEKNYDSRIENQIAEYNGDGSQISEQYKEYTFFSTIDRENSTAKNYLLPKDKISSFDSLQNIKQGNEVKLSGNIKSLGAALGTSYWLLVSDIKIERLDDGTVRWKTYRNDENKFEFKYPEDWKIINSSTLVPSEALSLHPEYRNCQTDECDLQAVIFFITQFAKISIFPAPNFPESTLEEVVKNVYKREIIGERMLAGIKAIETFTEGGEGTYGSATRALFFKVEKEIILLQLESSRIQEYNKIFDQILSTFKFIK